MFDVTSKYRRQLDMFHFVCGVHILVTQPVFVGLVDPLHFLTFNSTQSNNFMLKYSTDVYFILITSNTSNLTHSGQFTLHKLMVMVVLWVGWMGHQHSPPESSSWWLQRLGFLEHAVFSGLEVSPVPFLVPREEARPLELPSVPLWVQCHPDDKGVVCRYVQYVKEYHQWPV